VLGVRDADHEEASPDGATLIISRLECIIAGQARKVKLISGTNSAKAYGKYETIEHFRCSFGLNPYYRDAIIKEPLKIAGVDENEEVRIIEISDHPFFVATLFLPQLSSRPSEPHPLVVAYLLAASSFHQRKDLAPVSVN
jgi:CTP synthase (UTP-ammonia lyase)